MGRHEALQVVQATFYGILATCLVSLQYGSPALFHANIVETEECGSYENTEDKQNNQLPCFDVLELPDTSPDLSFICQRVSPPYFTAYSIPCKRIASIYRGL
jgi:hypothetical protein